MMPQESVINYPHYFHGICAFISWHKNSSGTKHFYHLFGKQQTISHDIPECTWGIRQFVALARTSLTVFLTRGCGLLTMATWLCIMHASLEAWCRWPCWEHPPGNYFHITEPGPWYDINILSYHCGDKTVIGSPYLHNRISSRHPLKLFAHY